MAVVELTCPHCGFTYRQWIERLNQRNQAPIPATGGVHEIASGSRGRRGI